MINNAAEMHKIVHGKKKNITLKDFVESYAFGEFISIGAMSILQKHGVTKTVNTVTEYNENSDMVAYTDNTVCYVNAASEMFDGMDENGELSIEQSYDLILGAVFHEMGHVIYTDFAASEKRTKEVLKNDILPKVKSGVSKEHIDTLKIIKDQLDKGYLIQDSTGFSIPLNAFVLNLFQSFDNIVEDGRIEKLLLEEDYGFGGYCHGLEVMRKKHADEILSSNKSIEEEDLISFSNMMLGYAKYSIVPEKMDNFPLFEEAIPVIDKMTSEFDPEKFADRVLELVAISYPFFKDSIVEPPEDQDQNQNQQDQGEGSNNNNSNGFGNGTSPQDPGDDSEQKQNNGNKNRGMDSLNDVMDGVKNAVDTEVPTYMNDTPKPKVKSSQQNDQNQDKNNQRGSDFGRILKSAKEEAQEKEAEKNQTEHLEQVASKWSPEILSGSPDIYVIDKNCADQAERREVEKIEEKFNAKVKKAARNIESHIQQDMRTRTAKRKFTGKKFNAGKVVNNDLRYFENKAVQKDVPVTAVALCIDQSGSMWGQRSQNAKEAAICLYDIFEQISNFDVGIFGHNYTGSFHLHKYCDFGFKPKNIKYCLSKIDGCGSNYDAMAIRLIGDRLEEVPADLKIMFIITDGLPYSFRSDYDVELRELVKDYKRAGVQVIITGIGDDIERLKELYEGQNFLDISDSSKLPDALVSLIRRKL